MIIKIFNFLKHDIWRIRVQKLPRYKYFPLRLLRVFLLALRGFAENKCQLWASALTFYTLFSIVPIVAMAFGVAKGFGLEKNLEVLITEKLHGQEEVIQWIIKFSKSFLANAKGGLIAGIGVAVLFWTSIKVLGNIEDAFNEIWGIKKARSWVRKVSDYLSVIIVCPLLLIVSSSLTLFITRQITLITGNISFLGGFNTLISPLFSLLPYMMVWMVFTFFYKFIPNTKVTFKSAALAGIIAGTLYQIVQWAYFYFQIGVTNYNAVYGSFAALPLFLVWLQFSWLVVLFGAEISFAVDNEHTYEFEKDCLDASIHFKRLLALRIAELSVKNFVLAEKPWSAVELSHQLEAPIRLIREMLRELVNAKILVEIRSTPEAIEFYQPAQDVQNLTIGRVLDLLDHSGYDNVCMVKEEELKKISEQLFLVKRCVENSKENILLKDL